MSYETITVAPSSPRIGAEIGNVDLTQPLSNKQVTELHKAFSEHGVIFFRDQKISHVDQCRLASYFGKLHQHVGTNTTSEKTETPFVQKMHFDENSTKIAGEIWHTDQTCAPIPPLASMLYNHIVPPYGGGDTMFASMYAAYDALSPNMKTYLEGLTATHDGVKVFGPGTPISVHPVIVRHPVTGKKLIFVNRGFTTKLNELPRKEGDLMLQLLLDYIIQPEWICRFRWSAHSIALWDNRCTQHHPINDYWPNVRSGFRVQIEGEAPPVAG